MRILVFVKEIPDVRIPVEYDEFTGRIREDWTVPVVNPQDMAAIMAALRLKADSSQSKIIVIHLGPLSAEGLIRSCIALGCDEGIRIWDEGFERMHPHTKAMLFSRIARIIGFDLILTGTKSMDTANGQVPILLSSRLQIPCVTSVVGLKLTERVVEVLKGLGSGYQARIKISLPAVIGMESFQDGLLHPPCSAILNAALQDIPCWELADIGLPRTSLTRIEKLLFAGPLRFPAPRLRIVPAPDSELSGFLRMQGIVEGAVKKRGGKLTAGDEDAVIEELYQRLQKDGWLDHLTNGAD